MNKKILIVGGTSGLGRKLAELYLAEGFAVGIVGRRENLLHEIKQQFPDNIEILKADVSESNIQAALMNFIYRMGGIDIFILTASIGEFNEELSLEKELNAADTNVKGYITALNVAWHYFRQKGNGHIVAVTSIAAARGNKAAPAYNASKAFQSNYIEGLRVKSKFEKNKIIITELIPGYIDTAMGKGDRMFWITTLGRAAQQSKQAIDKKRTRAFITKRWWLIYQVLKFLPIFIYDSFINGSWKMKHKN
jgi:short-subunit dehydrogenase